MTNQTSDTIKSGTALIGAILAISAIVFAAGNYPTRKEWEQQQTRQREQIDALKENVGALKLEQVRLLGTMDSIRESQQRTEKAQTEIKQALSRVLEKRR